ncbi:MAG: hypothetical protein JXR42_01445 [Gammaproteobacteria bacterium]|nr:hypothetical protein [Gammaproteobacteria bacterium]
MQNLTTAISNKLDSHFNITQNGSSIKTELLAGLTTFLTMSYIRTYAKNIFLKLFSDNFHFSA